MRVMTAAADVRAAARRGAWHGTTGGHCPAYQQANLVILPQEAAVEFAAFCMRNPTPCPLIEITPPGDPEPMRAAPGADLRTDLPGYRIYRKGVLAEQRSDIRDLWQDDLVAFLLGCSLTVEHALIEAGVPIRNVDRDTQVRNAVKRSMRDIEGISSTARDTGSEDLLFPEDLLFRNTVIRTSPGG